MSQIMLGLLKTAGIVMPMAEYVTSLGIILLLLKQMEKTCLGYAVCVST